MNKFKQNDFWRKEDSTETYLTVIDKELEISLKKYFMAETGYDGDCYKYMEVQVSHYHEEIDDDVYDDVYGLALAAMLELEDDSIVTYTVIPFGHFTDEELDEIKAAVEKAEQE